MAHNNLRWGFDNTLTLDVIDGITSTTESGSTAAE